MATRVVLDGDLDMVVASRFLPTHIDRIAAEVRDAARRNAPPVKVWQSVRDDRVRPTHDPHGGADGQVVPDNLRFILDRPKASSSGDVSGQFNRGRSEMARYPRDPNLSPGNKINCRCAYHRIPDAISRQIHAHPAQVHGTRVAAEVDVRFPRVVESEFPSEPDSGGRWMGRAVDEVAARTRARGRPS